LELQIAEQSINKEREQEMSETTFLVIGIIIFVCGIGLTAISITTASAETADKSKLSGICFVIIGMLLLAFRTQLSESSYTINEKTKPVERNLSEYTAYLDGESVDLDKINLSFYRVKYDDEKKIIYLTEKKDTTFIPFFIPSAK